MNRSSKTDSQTKYTAKNSSTNIMTKCLVVICSRLLMKFLCNKSSFPSLNRPNRIIFNTINSLTTDHVHLRLKRNKNPSFVHQKCVKLGWHILLPHGIFYDEKQEGSVSWKVVLNFNIFLGFRNSIFWVILHCMRCISKNWSRRSSKGKKERYRWWKIFRVWLTNWIKKCLGMHSKYVI